MTTNYLNVASSFNVTVSQLPTSLWILTTSALHLLSTTIDDVIINLVVNVDHFFSFVTLTFQLPSAMWTSQLVLLFEQQHHNSWITLINY